MKLDVKDLYNGIKDYMDKEVTLQGWIKNHRKQKEFGFIDDNGKTVKEYNTNAYNFLISLLRGAENEKNK